MGNKKHRADLEAEMAELRRELAALRDGLAERVHTRHLVVDPGAGAPSVEVNVEGLIVADAASTVELRPGRVMVCHDESRSHVTLSCVGDGAEVHVSTGDDMTDVSAALVATTHYGYQPHPDRPAAFVAVNGEELPVPAAAGG